MIAKTILTPFSWLYGLITGTRNLLYDKSLLKTYYPDLPVIVVGNLIAGGTGKTPMVAWIAGELAKKYCVAILSRGYGRKTRGFQVLDSSSTPESAGDEPMELRLLLPDITIATDANRKRGILNLTSGKYGEINLIIMDDGFQHRRITPGFAIVLDDFNRPMRSERLLPAGLRREPLSGLKRADLIIQTKRHQANLSFDGNSGIILVTGIANPKPLADEISRSGQLLKHLKYPDHHRYTRADADTIRAVYDTLSTQTHTNKLLAPIILTTGKDYVKLKQLPGLSDIPLRWIPNGPPVDQNQKIEILNKINQYVEETYGNS